MAAANRLRCPRCGMCYEGDKMASDVQVLTCQACGAVTKLVEEDPEGVLSGALPPQPRLLALTAALVLSLLAVKFSFFAVLAVGVLVYLAMEIWQGHKRQRTDRIELWDRLRDAYTALTERNKTLSEELAETRRSLTEEMTRAYQTLAELSFQYKAIAPERRDQLASEIVTQQKVLGVLGDLTALAVEKDTLQGVIRELRARIISFEEEELLQSFGFYKPMYDCVDSAAYRQLLDKIRDRQKQLVKEKLAIRVESVFSVGNDRSGGKKIAKNLEKLILRAFNGECDATIDNVTFSNIDAIKARITKSYQDMNELGQIVGISISQAYLNAKIEELYVCHEYQMKLKDEREEQRKIREQTREDARLIKEIEEARMKIEKEETHFNQAIAELRTRMDAAAASERGQYEAKLREYEAKLTVVQKDKEEVAYREQSTRAGYVYIISNIGSFGDNVYKIGVTRRLEPQDRIDELGDASVPFGFDVHAMIFSDDAPTLEGALHQHFGNTTINKINARKEFFRASLDEIEEVVRTHHNKVVEFTKVAKAEAYRLTLAKERALVEENVRQGATNG